MDITEARAGDISWYILTMKDNRLRQLEPGYARWVWYVMYQLLSAQLFAVCTRTWAKIFIILLLKTLLRKSLGYFRPAIAGLRLRWYLFLTNVCYIVLLQMFSIDWALKDVSITAKVKKLGKLITCTAVNSLSKFHLIAPNHYRSKKI